MDRVAHELGIRVRPFVRDGRRTGRWQISVPPKLTSTQTWQKKIVRSEAEGWTLASELVRTLRLRGEVSLTRHATSQTLSVEEAFDLWLGAQVRRAEAGKKRRSSIETNIAQLSAIRRFLPPGLALADVTEARLERYQAHRRALGRQPETINSEVRTFLQVQAWAVRQGLLTSVTQIDPVPEPFKEKEILEIAEYLRLLAALPERLRPVVQILAETGCRRGEALNMLWKDVDFDAGIASIRIRSEWTPKTSHSVRPLHLSPALMETLAALPRNSAYVFPGIDPSKPVTSFRRAFATAVRTAGITKKVTPKTLRASYTTWQAERGAAEAVVQRLLGHAPGSRVTRRHYDMSHRRKAARSAAEDMWSELRPPGRPL
jgi:integrase